MDASTRLYQRLAEIPEDPEDPESLDDLIVCAFGAFERYYVCWKTKGGEYRQDGYDLPPALHEWLYPSDGTRRDFASLQVVFGRGEEYFASDKNGKLEYKEPEVRKQVEEEEKIDRMALRRSRTVSFLRPLSDTSVKSDATSADSFNSRQSRSSSMSSQRASRPPSLTNSRTSSDGSVASRPSSRPLSIVSTHARAHSSLSSQWALGSEDTAKHKCPDTAVDMKPPRSDEATKIITAASELQDPTENPQPCTCGHRASQPPQPPRPAYANASVQTDPAPSPLRIDTSTPPMWSSQNSYSAVSQDSETPLIKVNPLVVGRSIDYFSKPDYQLGDSLTFGYHSLQPLVYQYQDEFVGDDLH